jgi:hypothetical protein
MNPQTRKNTLDNPGITIWQIYNDRAKLRDKTLLKDWESSIHSLLLFVSAAFTTSGVRSLTINLVRYLLGCPYCSMR